MQQLSDSFIAEGSAATLAASQHSPLSTSSGRIPSDAAIETVGGGRSECGAGGGAREREGGEGEEKIQAGKRRRGAAREDAKAAEREKEREKEGGERRNVVEGRTSKGAGENGANAERLTRRLQPNSDERCSQPATSSLFRVPDGTSEAVALSVVSALSCPGRSLGLGARDERAEVRVYSVSRPGDQQSQSDAERPRNGAAGPPTSRGAFARKFQRRRGCHRQKESGRQSRSA